MVQEFDVNSLTPLIPEIAVITSALILLMVGAFSKKESGALITKAAILVVVVALFLLLKGGSEAISLNSMFLQSEFTIFVKALILAASGVVLLLSLEPYSAAPTLKEPKPVAEFPVLILLSVAGMMIMVSANDLISLYMGLEMQSLCLYVLAASHRDTVKSSEAGLKYFVLGALSSGILLYGCSLIYGFSGTTNFTAMAELYSASQINVGALVGMVLVLIGLCFKVSAVPFHMWTPDVYEGSPTIVTSFFAAVPKVAGIAIFIRFMAEPFGKLFPLWQDIVILIALVSMVVGALGALKQTNIKRLMAYSSIGHVGYILVGLAAASEAGYEGMLVYIALYVTMSVGAFACILMLKQKGVRLEKLSDLSGLAGDRPRLAFAFAVLMLSMAGIPPLAGFFGKLMVFSAAVNSGLYTLAIVGVLSSAVAAFYYLKIIKLMYFDKAKTALDATKSLSVKAVLVSSVIVNILFFVYPNALIIWAETAAKALAL